jgi:cell division transport system permease protein
VSRVRLLFSESLRSLGANLSTTVASTFTVLIGMFLLGLVIALGTWALSYSDYAKRQLEVKVFFCAEFSAAPCTGEQAASEKQIDAMRIKIESNPLVADNGVELVTRAEALQEMKRRRPDLVKSLVSNPLPASFRVTPRDGDNVKTLAGQLRTPLLPGVEKVQDGEEVADRVLTVAKVISTTAGVATVILLITSVLLIANTIRLSIFSRRREIEVMKLVGATNWFVRGPFMLEGLICGLVGSVAAVLLLLAGKEIVLPLILSESDTGSSNAEAIAFGLNALLLVGVGLVVGVLGSGLTMRRFLQV